MKLTEKCRDSILEALDMMNKADKIKCSKCDKEMLSKVTNLGKVKVLESYCSYCPKGGNYDEKINI